MTFEEKFVNDYYFMANVHLIIKPNKERNYTEVLAIVKNRSSKINYKWWLDVLFYSEDCKQILEEIKKDEYCTNGYSESY